MNISLDGYCDHTLGIPSDEMMDYFTNLMADVDLMFYGRTMYEMMFPYWADVARDRSGSPAENRFADRICAIENIVMSKSTTDSSPAEVLRKLKRSPGQTISVDTVSMLPELITAGLIDEFHLVIHPVFSGNGRPLLPSGSLPDLTRLKLTGTQTFANGCVALRYTLGD